MSAPGNWFKAIAAKLGLVPVTGGTAFDNGVALQTQAGHATPPAGVQFIFNNNGVISRINSSGTITSMEGGGGGGGVDNPMTANLDAGGYDISNINILTVTLSAYLPTSTTIGTFIPATLDNPTPQTFSSALNVTGGVTATVIPWDLSAVTVTMGNIAGTVTIDGKTPVTLEGLNQNFDSDVSFDQQISVTGAANFFGGIALHGGTAGQFAAIADATGGVVVDTEARDAINALLAGLRTRGDLAT